MTRIEFFFNVGNKLDKVAELSQRAVSKGRRTMVFGPDDAVLTELERVLWSGSALSFVPHCRAQHPLAPETPIVLDFKGEPLVHDDVLINLQHQHPPFFSRFRRLIEIVGTDEADKAQARVRYRFYRDRGYEIRTFDENGAAL